MSLDLSALDGPAEPANAGQASGAPLQLPVADIDEDPKQPRQEFDDDALQELAQTIAERGVRQPVSVRPHPEQPGRWMLNFGARRLRASKLAGKTQIPAFVDESADSYDQVIENEQRQGLKPLELALFVQRRMAQGETQAQIARTLGKSRQYVAMATALIDAPAWLLETYRQGRCRGMNELHMLRRMWATDAKRIEDWVAGCGDISRDKLVALKDELPSASVAALPTPPEPPKGAVPPISAAASAQRGVDPDVAVPESLQPRHTSAARLQRPRPVLRAQLGTAVVRIELATVPDEPGHVFVEDDSGRGLRRVRAGDLALLGFDGD